MGTITRTYPSCHFETPDPILQKPPLIGPQGLRIDYQHTSDASPYATLLLHRNPAQSVLVLEGNQTVPIDKWPISFLYALDHATEQTNQFIHQAPQAEASLFARHVLFENYERFIQAALAGHYQKSLPFGCPLTTEEKLPTLPATVKPIDLLEIKDYNKREMVLMGNFRISVISQRPLWDDQITRLKYYLQTLPEEVQEYFQKTHATDPLAIAIVSPAELAQLAEVESHTVRRAAYSRYTKILYFPDNLLVDRPTPEATSHFHHEFYHATFDRISPDSLSFDLWNKVSRHALESRWETHNLYDTFLPRTLAQVLVDVLAGGSAIASLVLGVHVLRKFPKTRYGLLAVVTLGVLFLAWDQLRFFNANRQGLISTEFRRLREKGEGDLYNYQNTVSAYAGSDPDEFSAETLVAYFQTKEDVLKKGYYVTDTNHGFKTREELMQKHPRLFLAYELFFAKDSRARFDARAFQEDSIMKINEALRQSMQGNQQPNLIQARRQLFSNHL
ncbi:MAG: hypothetical protein HYW02_00920 [Deltaproteobacteria bacterium]|nr:hypothetical protein [Deltaproteobacteria bacterium]